MKPSPLFGILVCSSALFVVTPARSEPCLSSEAMAHIRQRLGDIPGTIMLGSIGLGTCNNTTSQEEEQLKRQLAAVEAEAPLSEPEIQQCKTTNEMPSDKSILFFAPGELTPPRVTCNCTSYQAENKKLRNLLARAHAVLSKTK